MSRPMPWHNPDNIEAYITARCVGKSSNFGMTGKQSLHGTRYFLLLGRGNRVMAFAQSLARFDFYRDQKIALHRHQVNFTLRIAVTLCSDPVSFGTQVQSGELLRVMSVTICAPAVSHHAASATGQDCKFPCADGQFAPPQ